MKVKVLEIDPRGKVRLSMRVVDQETGAELEDTRPPREGRAIVTAATRGDRGDPRRDGEGRGDRGGGVTAARGVTAAAVVTWRP